MRGVIHRFVLGLTLARLLEIDPAAAQATTAPAPPPETAAQPAPAGSPAPAPATASAAAAATSDNPVGFVTDETGLTVLRRPVTPAWRDGSKPSDEEFSPLCQAPCQARLDASPYQFAVRRGDGPILPGALAYEVREPTTFRATVISHADTRKEGWYVFGIVSGAGVISTTIALTITCGEDRECAKWESVAFWGGLGALSLGALIGLPMALRKDDLSISVMPVVPTLSSPSSRFWPARWSEHVGTSGGISVSGAL